jgi:hypothetical protein
MIDLESLGITEKVLIDNGFSVGTAYNIMKGKISKKSLLKLYELGLIEEVSDKEKFVCSNNNLFGEYEVKVEKKDLVLFENAYKIRLFLNLNNTKIIYYLDTTDIIDLNAKNIDILSCNSVIVKIVGKKITFIRSI